MAVPVALESVNDSLTMIVDSVNHVGVARRDGKDYLQIQMSTHGPSFKEILLSQQVQADDRIKHLIRVTEERRKAWMESALQLEAAEKDLVRIVQFLKQIEAEAAQALKPTIKQAVLEALKHKPEGMTALEILDEINARYFGGEILRTSLSPQL